MLSNRDKEIQVAWGIEDFVYRFRRRPEGMWLPECAVDNDSLATLARAGIKYTILAPSQGRFIRDDAAGSEVGPFEWRQGDLSIAIFRFQRDLSGEIAFGDLLSDGQRLANCLADVALAQPPGAAVMIATDGETFGHHKKTGAAELARAFSLLTDREGIVVTNCAEYLAGHPARGRFEIDGATSWSCTHGVERWRSNCGCRLEDHTSQEWRGPLRAAMEFIKNHADAVYDRFAPPLVDDPGAALREAIRLFIEDDPSVAEEAFFARHKVTDENSRFKLLRLLEMQRAAQATHTSCAWFFDDFGGPEGRIALRWAARTEELAAEFVPSVEHELLGRLREIHSNRHEVGDAASLYMSLKTREARGRV